jgi:hypothetical protein
MSLLDEIRGASKQRHRTCIIVEILDELAIEDARELQVALDDSAMTHVAIARVLSKRGYPVGLNGKQIANHRNGSCPCRG